MVSFAIPCLVPVTEFLPDSWTDTVHRYFFNHSYGSRLKSYWCSWMQSELFYRIYMNPHYFWMRRCRKVKRVRKVDGLVLIERSFRWFCWILLVTLQIHCEIKRCSTDLLYLEENKNKIEAWVCIYSMHSLFVHRSSPAKMIFSFKRCASELLIYWEDKENLTAQV